MQALVTFTPFTLNKLISTSEPLTVREYLRPATMSLISDIVHVWLQLSSLDNLPYTTSGSSLHINIRPSRAAGLSYTLFIHWFIEHGLTSAPTQYRSYDRRFLQVWWPNQQYQSTEGGWLVIQTGLSLTRLTSQLHTQQRNDTALPMVDWLSMV